MTLKEFLTHCDACGGNWVAMIGSGIKRLWPDDYDKLPQTFTIENVVSVLRKHSVLM